MAGKEIGKRCKNITWELNHQIIRDSYMKLIKLNQKKPTIKEVSEDTDLSMQAIDRHLRELKFDPIKHPLRILSDDVLLAIVSSAKAGSSASQKLWMQLCEGWSEKQEVDLKSKGESIRPLNIIVDSLETAEVLKQLIDASKANPGIPSD